MVITKLRDKLDKNIILVAKKKTYLATTKKLDKNHFYKKTS